MPFIQHRVSIVEQREDIIIHYNIYKNKIIYYIILKRGLRLYDNVSLKTVEENYVR